MTTQSAVKVDPATHNLISHGATALHMTQKELLAAAVREYLGARREEINTRLRETMKILDGSAESHVSAITGISREKINKLGGVREE